MAVPSLCPAAGGQREGPAGAEGSRLVAASSQRDSPGVQNLLHRFCERVLCSPVWGRCLPVNDLLCVPAPSCSPQPWGGRKSLPVRPDIVRSLGPPKNLSPVDRGCQIDLQSISLTQHEQDTPAALPWECPALTSGVSLHLLQDRSWGREAAPCDLDDMRLVPLLLPPPDRGRGGVSRHPAGGDKRACKTLSPCPARRKARSTSHVTEQHVVLAIVFVLPLGSAKRGARADPILAAHLGLQPLSFLGTSGPESWTVG